jgi:glycosyltransferase involved in cell wall biosynthesis
MLTEKPATTSASIADGIGKFVVATPQRSVCDDNARVLEQASMLRFLALGTRRGTAGVSDEHTRLNPGIGLLTYAATRTLSTFHSESFRFRLLPWFDNWVLRQLHPGDHMISSYGYANKCFRYIRKNGGKTFVDAGNSHMENFWEILSEENRRWKCSAPPVARHWYERSKAMLNEGVDYVLSPSSFVSQSFLTRGYKPEQILRNVYPVDLSLFKPSDQPRPKDRPLTIINTGMLSLRKGTPYLLEAFRIIHREHPSARLLLTDTIRDDAKQVLASYSDLPIDWSSDLSHVDLAQRLRSADIFVFPSLEDGWARTVCEAMGCGLPVVVTPNTGASDAVKPGVNGEIVPIRDPRATAEAALRWWERLRSGYQTPRNDLAAQLSFETFAREFTRQLRVLGLLPHEEEFSITTK